MPAGDPTYCPITGCRRVLPRFCLDDCKCDVISERAGRAAMLTAQFNRDDGVRPRVPAKLAGTRGRTPPSVLMYAEHAVIPSMASRQGNMC